MSNIETNRKFMHCPSFAGEMAKSDQQNGVEAPNYENYRTGDFITLLAFDDVQTMPTYQDLLENRQSERVYTDEPMTQAQLAFMLWSSLGIKAQRGVSTFRPVPSGGARHPFEIYVVVKNVIGLEPGIYHYVPTKNIGEKLVTIERIAPLFDDYDNKMNELLVGQKWAVKAPVVLFMSCIPYRAEWRYSVHAHRVMLIDLGHVGQNMMLSATAMGIGSCCLAAFDQEKCDELFEFNSIDEYTVYVLTLGVPKVREQNA